MKMRTVVAGSLLFFSVLACAGTSTYQYPQADPLPEDSTTNLLRDPTLLSDQDLHMSGERFFNAWTSKTNERERIKADLYLLGVLDTTEGTVWCGYSTVKTITLHERVYSYFRDLSPQRLKNERATTLILEAMKQHGTGPCQPKKP